MDDLQLLMLNVDLGGMSREQLQQEVIKLRKAIRYHRDQKGDDNCWLDDFVLYGALPEQIKANPELPDKELMMVNCSRYYDCRKAGKLYIPLETLDESARNNPQAACGDDQTQDGSTEECT